MKITPEIEMELARFPAVLRTLIEAELASGNSIIEVGHGFPAPPVGAYVKLANKVSTRARVDGDGLSFYDRDNSSYSGEFTDAKRFYFVLEPPNPPPGYPDMDAIRKSLEPKANLTNRDVRTNSSQDERVAGGPKQQQVDWDSSQAFSLEESDTRATRELHFRDQRPPHEVQCALERTIRTLFTPAMEEGKLCLRAKANVVGAKYDFLLRFEAALTLWNCYSLRADVVWGELPSDHVAYYRKTSGSWFEHWTSDLTKSNRHLASEESAERYRQLCEEALNAEKHLELSWFNGNWKGRGWISGTGKASSQEDRRIVRRRFIAYEQNREMGVSGLKLVKPLTFPDFGLR